MVDRTMAPLTSLFINSAPKLFASINAKIVVGSAYSLGPLFVFIMLETICGVKLDRLIN